MAGASPLYSVHLTQCQKMSQRGYYIQQCTPSASGKVWQWAEGKNEACGCGIILGAFCSTTFLGFVTVLLSTRNQAVLSIGGKREKVKFTGERAHVANVTLFFSQDHPGIWRLTNKSLVRISLSRPAARPLHSRRGSQCCNTTTASQYMPELPKSHGHSRFLLCCLFA